MSKLQKYNNIPIFIPELACPNRCIFCNQNKISGVIEIIKPEEICLIIEKYLATIPAENHVEIAFFGGNFTGIDINIQEAYLLEANKYVKTGKVKGIRLSTRPDYISTEILDLLKYYGVTTIELGAQSSDDEVLRKSKRGTCYADILKSAEMIKNYGFSLGLQMMLGLPGDSFEKSLKTAADFVNLQADNTRIYPLLVIKDTVLEKLYYSGSYKPLSLEEAVFQAKEVYKIFNENSVKIIKVGLHPSEEFNSGNSLIAGPYHQSFKELVLTELWIDIFKNYNFVKTEKLIEIFVNKEQINYAVGYGSKNLNYLKNNGLKVKFCFDSSLKEFEFYVRNN